VGGRSPPFLTSPLHLNAQGRREVGTGSAPIIDVKQDVEPVFCRVRGATFHVALVDSGTGCNPVIFQRGLEGCLGLQSPHVDLKRGSGFDRERGGHWGKSGNEISVGQRGGYVNPPA